MNPLAKAVGTLLVLAAGTLGTSLGTDLDPLALLPPLPTGRTSEESGNGTGNETGAGGSGNQTAGNQTAGGNETSSGNQTGNATGNETTDGNETAENETAEPEPTEPADPAVCNFYVDEHGDALMPDHHEWEWLVTSDVTHLSVSFHAYGGLPGLGSSPDAELIDGRGRTVARVSGEDGGISVTLERGTDYLASGLWRLSYDSSDVGSGYSVSIHVGCGEAEAQDEDEES